MVDFTCLEVIRSMDLSQSSCYACGYRLRFSYCCCFSFDFFPLFSPNHRFNVIGAFNLEFSHVYTHTDRISWSIINIVFHIFPTRPLDVHVDVSSIKLGTSAQLVFSFLLFISCDKLLLFNIWQQSQKTKLSEKKKICWFPLIWNF